MRVVVAGGHGQVALFLQRSLAARGDEAVGLIRNPAHAADLAAAGAVPLVVDLERSTAPELAEHLRGADAVVFAAGAGPGSDAARKDTVDRGGAVLLADAAELAGVGRYLLLSSAGAGSPPPEGVGEIFAAYLVAKGAAEEDVRGRGGLAWTVLRPGPLSDDPPTGTVAIPATDRAPVSRADTAAVLVALLDAPPTAGLTLELRGGDVPIATAVAAALPSYS